ncbi:hypothetical protein GCM10020258_23920 [Sphingomonas yabuuchiae]
MTSPRFLYPEANRKGRARHAFPIPPDTGHATAETAVHAVTPGATYISENRFILSFPLPTMDKGLVEFGAGKLPWGGPDRAIRIAKRADRF